MLGVAPCAGAAAEPSPERSAMAWTICWLAWRMVWGIDITQPGANVEKCLQQLFRDWCCGFHYKGPRCDCDAHGIILGCVKISPKGRVLCFDEWCHRRYVLTGPLVTHWGGQFGLAPLDVVATRLATWICCVTRAPRPERPEFDLAALEEVMLPIGSAGIGFGAGLGATLMFRGLPVDAGSHSVGPMGFLGAALSAITRDGVERFATATAVRRISMRGTDLHLMMPVDRGPVAIRHDTGATEAIMMPHVAAAPPMARAAAVDFAAAVARETALADLDDQGSELFASMVAALDLTGIPTVSRLLDDGPEAALARVRAALAADPAFAGRGAPERAMNLVYGAAQATVADAAAAIAEMATARDEDEPFIREDLAETPTISAVRKAVNAHLRGRGVAASTLRDIASRVVAAKT
jgi:hypothetical protein